MEDHRNQVTDNEHLEQDSDAAGDSAKAVPLSCGLTGEECERTWRQTWEPGEYRGDVNCWDGTNNVWYRSKPFVRVFTFSYDAVSSAYQRLHQMQLKSTEEVQAKVEEIKRSIEEIVDRHIGLTAAEAEGPTFGEGYDGYVIGFMKGFGNDDHIQALFFSELSKKRATEEIIGRWGQYGVATEKTAEEFEDDCEFIKFRQYFSDEDAFLAQFLEMAETQRVKTIADLWKRGVEFTAKDKSSGTVYTSESHNRVFHLDYELGLQGWWNMPGPKHDAIEEPSIEEKTRTIVQIERSIQEIIERNGGVVEDFVREMHHEPSELWYMATFEGHTMIFARFRSETDRDQATQEAIETWEIYGVESDADPPALSPEEELAEIKQKTELLQERNRKSEEFINGLREFEARFKEMVLNEQIAEWEAQQKKKS